MDVRFHYDLIKRKPYAEPKHYCVENYQIKVCCIAKMTHFWCAVLKVTHQSMLKTSIDVLPSKNQVLGEYCTHVSKLKHC